MDPSDMVVGQFSITQPNPTHQFTDPTQPTTDVGKHQHNALAVAKQTPNLDFKVTIFFNVKFLENCTIQLYSLRHTDRY